ncbi:MAG: hypothetical protein ACR2LX_01365 [Jatrophihabitans sp.]
MAELTASVLRSPAVAASPVPVRPLGVAELLDTAVRLVRRNARASFSLSFPFAVVRAGLVALLLLQTAHSRNFATVQLLLELFVSALFGTMLTGLLAPVFIGEVLGRRLHATQAMATARTSLFALAAMSLVVAAAQEVGVVVLFVGGAWLWGIWAVAAPALVIERLGAGRALARSFHLVRTDYWRTWGIRALRWLLTTTLGLFLTIPFTAIAAAVSGSDLLATDGPGISNPGVYVAIVAVGNLLATTVLTPISAAVDSLLYLDLRMRREGLDLVLGLPPVAAQPAAQAW